MPRVYERKFDWDEARERVAAGETMGKLAEEYGVTRTAISRVMTEERLRMSHERSSAWIRNGTCVDCGGPASRRNKQSQLRCQECSHRAMASNVREGELRCPTCGEWKPDDAFPFNRAGKKTHRGRHETCRACLTLLKRKWRSRNPNYERDYYRRRKSEGADSK